MSAPRVSVVVPTRDRADRLRVLLDSLATQKLPGDEFEVLVVDDGSSAPLDARADPGFGDGQIELRVVRHDRSRGPAAARNSGWRAARAPLVAFTDDDCRADPGWLRGLIESSNSRGDVIVQGRTVPDPRDRAMLRPFSRTQAVGGPDQLYETCNIAYPHPLLERVGGFDERYRNPCGEDVDLGWRARKAGGRLVFDEDAVVYHAVTNPGLYRTIRQTMLWTDAVRVLKSHPELRDMLVARCFWKRSHPALILLLSSAAMALARRRTFLAGAGALPYLVHYRRVYGGASRPWMAAIDTLPRHLAIDLVELGTMLAGSLRHRTLML